MLLDRCKFSTTTVGTGNLTGFGNITGYRTPSGAAAIDGFPYTFLIEDGNAWEKSVVVFSSAGTVGARTLVESSTGALLALSGTATCSSVLYSRDSAAPGAGILTRSSATALLLSPKNGNLIKLEGVWFEIPDAGVSGANTGVRVDGVNAQNLAANTTYLVTLFNNAGTLAYEYRTTLTHAPDTTANNKGVEVCSATGRTVLGMCRTNGSSQFVDTNAARLVLSWYNRRPLNTKAAPANTSTSNTPGDVIMFATGIEMLSWADSAVFANINAQGTGTASFAHVGIYYDNSTLNPFEGSQYVYANGGAIVPLCLGGWDNVAEGYHAYGMGGGNSSGAGTLTINNPRVTGVTFG
jgi:hypothetical protein